MKHLIKLSAVTIVCALAASVAHAGLGYFRDDFRYGFNGSLWAARNGRNGSPFGCAFYDTMFDKGSNWKLDLKLWNGACAELQSKGYYGNGTFQGRWMMSNVPGTVSSLFTYTSWWDAPGRPWQEIDIEYLPSNGNVMHTNVIYQACSTCPYYSWERDIYLGSYGVNFTTGYVAAGFEWKPNTIKWFVWNAAGKKTYLRTVTRGVDIPWDKWPVSETRVMINYWHGDNSSQALYFPKRYTWGSGVASYDWVEYYP